MKDKISIRIGGAMTGEAEKASPVNVPKVEKKKTLTDAQIARIMELYSEGVSQRKIATEVGTTPTTVRKVIKGEY